MPVIYAICLLDLRIVKWDGLKNEDAAQEAEPILSKEEACELVSSLRVVRYADTIAVSRLQKALRFTVSSRLSQAPWCSLTAVVTRKPRTLSNYKCI